MHKCKYCPKKLFIPSWKICDNCLQKHQRVSSLKYQKDKRKKTLSTYTVDK